MVPKNPAQDCSIRRRRLSPKSDQRSNNSPVRRSRKVNMHNYNPADSHEESTFYRPVKRFGYSSGRTVRMSSSSGAMKPTSRATTRRPAGVETTCGAGRCRRPDQPRQHVRHRPGRHPGRCRGCEVVPEGRRAGTCQRPASARIFKPSSSTAPSRPLTSGARNMHTGPDYRVRRFLV